MPHILILSLGAFLLAWQVWGLRFTNGDDIMFALQAAISAGDKFSFAHDAARMTGRLQAYLNMPISLLVLGLADSVLYDLLNVGSILACYASALYFLARIGSFRNAASCIAIALFLFPLHYYFSFPQGYAVMGCWGLSLALLSAGLFQSYLQTVARWKLRLSLFLFFLSLWGPEYNFVLHPVLLLLIAWADGLRSRNALSVGWPYAALWIFSLIAYLSFSVAMHDTGGDTQNRIVPGLDIIAGLKTFLILEEKAFLPVALWRGIELSSATAQGGPEVPDTITIATLTRWLPDYLSAAILFLALWFFSHVALRSQSLTRHAAAHYAAFFLSIIVIPCAVVAMSALYQQTVLAGWVQGHLATFYIQLGGGGMLFVIAALICNAHRLKKQRARLVALAAMVFALLTTLTIAYNTLNRGVMSANMQKWDAVRTLAAIIGSERLELGRGVVYAPSLWTKSGVSGFPKNAPFRNANYWSDYARYVLGAPIAFQDSPFEPGPGAKYATYFSTPKGAPLVILYRQEPLGGANVFLFSEQPVSGKLTYKTVDGVLNTIDLDKWVCRRFCVHQRAHSVYVLPDSFSFMPFHVGETSLIAQFIAGRNGAYSVNIRK